jgi:hypothetical protein
MQDKANSHGTGSVDQRTDSRDQSCKTKPIWCARQERDALATNALRRHHERGPFRKTKPILTGRSEQTSEANRAKQSQLTGLLGVKYSAEKELSNDDRAVRPLEEQAGGGWTDGYGSSREGARATDSHGDEWLRKTSEDARPTRRTGSATECRPPPGRRGHERGLTGADAAGSLRPATWMN